MSICQIKIKFRFTKNTEFNLFLPARALSELLESINVSRKMK